VRSGAYATDNTSVTNKPLRLKVMGFVRGLIEARRRTAAHRRARRNQQLLDSTYKRDDEKNS
jgi:hypothetical protein